MVAAISFMEAPLKFQAPDVTLPIGLGIGRLIFFVLNKIEIVLAVMLVISFFLQRPKGKFAASAAAIILVLLGLETLWLLPALDVRAEQVINGTAAPFSNTHLFYIAFDAIKLVLLFLLGVSVAKRHLKFD